MDRELFEAARRVRERAHAPYSRFPVGCALRTESGEVYVGCNVENASFPEGWCAETTAIAHMVAAAPPGSGRRIAAVSVVADPIDGRLISPCGGCRQRLAEFAGPDTLVDLADPAGTRGDRYSMGELLPAAFALEGRA
jgi:cytidine deaminase